MTRVAVVTGGCQGIGLGIAKRFISDGMAVAVLDIDSNLDQVVSDLGDSAFGVHCDITDGAQIERAAEAIEDRFGQAAVLVNNAGWATKAPFLSCPVEIQQKILSVNLVATLTVTRQFLPGLLASDNGRVVMMSSDAARVGVPRESIYAAAKAGVVGFAKSLALEVARNGVTVNVISPGPIDTPLIHDLLTAEEIGSRERRNPMRRMGSVEEVAALASYIVSPLAAYVTGQVFSINGGLIRCD